MLGAEDFGQRARRGQRDDDRRDQRRSRHAEAEQELAGEIAEEGRDRADDLLDRVERTVAAGLAEGCGGRHQDGGHDELGDDGADRGVEPGGGQVLGRQALLGNRGLLEEHHPRHDDRADVGRGEQEVLRIVDGIVIAPDAISPGPGCASSATSRKTSSKAPTAIAMRSTVI